MRYLLDYSIKRYSISLYIPFCLGPFPCTNVRTFKAQISVPPFLTRSTLEEARVISDRLKSLALGSLKDAWCVIDMLRFVAFFRFCITFNITRTTLQDATIIRVLPVLNYHLFQWSD